MLDHFKRIGKNILFFQLLGRSSFAMFISTTKIFDKKEDSTDMFNLHVRLNQRVVSLWLALETSYNNQQKNLRWLLIVNPTAL